MLRVGKSPRRRRSRPCSTKRSPITIQRILSISRGGRRVETVVHLQPLLSPLPLTKSSPILRASQPKSREGNSHVLRIADRIPSLLRRPEPSPSLYLHQVQ